MFVSTIITRHLQKQNKHNHNRIILLNRMTLNKVFYINTQCKRRNRTRLSSSSVFRLMASFTVTYGDNDGAVYSLQCSWMNIRAPAIHVRMNITAVLKMKNLSKGKHNECKKIHCRGENTFCHKRRRTVKRSTITAGKLGKNYCIII